MPIYEFDCPSCCNRSSQLAKMGEDGSSVSCPVCGTVGLIKTLSVFASPRSGQKAGQPLTPCGTCSEARGCPRSLR